MPKNDVEIKLAVKDELSKQYKRIAKEVARINKRTGKSTKTLAADSEKSAERIKNSFGVIKTAAVGLAGFLTFKLGRAFIRAGSEVEDLTTQFKVLLGSTEAAQARMEELANFAEKTPFQLTQIATASRILETLTKGALSSGDGLRLVGDVAAATGQDFENLALHVGRAFDGLRNNRPVGESLARLQELGIVTGQTRAQIEQLTARGLGVQAWELLEKQLQKNDGGMLELSKTVTGLTSTIKDQLQAAMRQVLDSGVWDRLRALLQRVTAELQKLLEGDVLQKVGKAFLGLIDNLDVVIRIGKSLLVVFAAKKLLGIVASLKAFSVALTSINPALLALSGAILAIEGALALMNAEIEKNQGLDFTSESELKKTRNALALIQKMSGEIGNLRKEAAKGRIATRRGIFNMGQFSAARAKVEEFDAAVQQARKAYGESFDPKSANLDKLQQGLDNNIKSLQEAKKAAEEAKKANDNLKKGGTDKDDDPTTVIEGPGTSVDFSKIQAPIKKMEIALDRARTKRVDDARELNRELEILNQDSHTQELSRLQQFEDEKRRILEKGGEDTEQLEILVKNRREALEKEHSDRLVQQRQETAQRMANITLSSANQITSALGGLARVRAENESKAAEATGASEEKITSIRRRAFEEQKRFQQAGAVISGATAVLNALATPPFAVGLSLAGLATLTTGIQLATIEAQKFQNGGIVPGNSFSGDRVLARVNSGEAIFNRRQQRNLMDLANGRGGGGTRTFNFEAPQITIQNGDPAVVKAVVEETYQEQFYRFTEMEKDSQVHQFN